MSLDNDVMETSKRWVKTLFTDFYSKLVKFDLFLNCIKAVEFIQKSISTDKKTHSANSMLYPIQISRG